MIFSGRLQEPGNIIRLDARRSLLTAHCLLLAAALLITRGPWARVGPGPPWPLGPWLLARDSRRATLVVQLVTDDLWLVAPGSWLVAPGS